MAHSYQVFSIMERRCKANMNKFSQIISNVGVDVRIVLIAEQWAPSPFPGIIP